MNENDFFKEKILDAWLLPNEIASKQYQRGNLEVMNNFESKQNHDFSNVINDFFYSSVI